MGSESKSTGTDAATELQQLYDDLKGLSAEDRRAKLIELAKKKGPVTVYSSTPPEEAAPQDKLFFDSTGVKIERYRASATDGRTRILQEAKAGRRGADVAGYDGTEIVLIDKEKLLLPLESPYLDALPETSDHQTWAADAYNVFVASWNTENVKGDDAPTTWEEVLAFEDGLAIETGDYTWFATLVKDYFMGRQGMTEEAALDVFRNAMKHATPVSGHSFLVQLLAAGQFNMVTSAYSYKVDADQSDGAPVTWRNPAPVEPVVMRPNGSGILSTADNVPGALLYMDWSLSPEGQNQQGEQGYVPALPGTKGALDPALDKLPVNLDLVMDDAERTKWVDLYKDLVRRTGKKELSK